MLNLCAPLFGDVLAVLSVFFNEKSFVSVFITLMAHFFCRNWDTVGTDGEMLEKFALQLKKKGEAVAAIIDFLGMQAVDGTK